MFKWTIKLYHSIYCKLVSVVDVGAVLGAVGISAEVQQILIGKLLFKMLNVENESSLIRNLSAYTARGEHHYLS